MKIVKSVSSVLMLTMLVTGSMFGVGNKKEQVYPPVPAALRTPYALANSYSPASSSSSGSSSTTKSASSTNSAGAHVALSRDRDIEMQAVAIKLDSKFAAEDTSGCWARYKQSFAEAVKRNWDKLSPRTQKMVKLAGITAASFAFWAYGLTGNDYAPEVMPGILGLAALWVTRDDSFFVQGLNACVMASASAPFYYFWRINVPLITSGWYLFNATLKKIVDVVKPKKDVAVQCGPDLV